MNWNLSRASRQHSIVAASVGVFLIFCATSAPNGYAGIVSSSGVTVLGSPPPPSVLPGANTTSPDPIIFLEVIGIAPAGGIPVDHNGSVVTAAPVESANVVNPSLVNAVIPAGTPFESYFFHFDPPDGPATPYPSSTIEFNNKIIGVQLFTSGFTALQKPAATPYVGTLEAGDAAIGLNGGPPAAYYPGGVIYRGLEEDAMMIDLAGFRITLAGMVAGVEIDQVRIFTDVPEPGSAILALTGLLGLSFLAIKKSRASRLS